MNPMKTYEICGKTKLGHGYQENVAFLSSSLKGASWIPPKHT